MNIITEKIPSMTFDMEGNAQIHIDVPRTKIADIENSLKGMKPGKKYSVDMKEYRKRRSMDANAYCWVLLQKLAEKLHTTKEELYIEKVRSIGPFEIVPLKKEAVRRWIENWKEKGLGWYAEPTRESKIDGYVNVICYYGSSVYDTAEMSRLIDEIVNDCRDMGIETIPPDELNDMMKRWGENG